MGRVLGDRYRVISRLGEGGMGTVYLCEHAVLQRRFAVKVLRADLAADPELVDRFRNEAIAASRIGQENVVDVVDFGSDEDGSLYYVMEVLEGRSLGAMIRDEGPLGVLHSLDLLEQICHALAAAHARGVVHRDVKPDNVFVVRRSDGRERAKVIDFGISRVPGFGERLTRAGAIIGTPEYMAPEQASGAHVDHRADVYAAGVLAFELLTGVLPLEAPTPNATMEAHQTRVPDPPSRRVAGIPPEVDALVLRALAKRPEDRFASMDDLAAEVARIRAAISGEFGIAQARDGAVARPSGSGRPSRPRGDTVGLPQARGFPTPPPSSWGAGLAAAVVAGIVGAAAAGWLWQRPARSSAPATPATAQADALAPLAPPPPPPVLVGTAAPPADGRDRAARTHRAPKRPERPPDAELKDPYADEAKLKDPFP